MSLEVQNDGGILVRAPKTMGVLEIERFIRSKSTWIDQKRSQIQNRLLSIPVKSDMQIYHRGNVMQWGGSASALRRFEREQANRVFARMIKSGLPLIEQYANRYQGFSIKLLRRRWGSCSIAGQIVLNERLIRLPDSCIWGVVIHELVHLMHHNHSARFYAELERANPTYQESDALLNTWGYVVLGQPEKKNGALVKGAEIRTMLVAAPSIQ